MSSLPRFPAHAPILLTLLTAACGLPRDPEGTSERIKATHELRVGVSHNPPWTIASGDEPRGIEPELVRRIARQMGAHVEWQPGSESKLMEALHAHELHLVIGGFEKKTEWSAKAGLSQPFLKDSEGKQHVLLAGPGENGFILAVDRILKEPRR